MGIFGSARNFSACVNVVETVEAVADAALNKKISAVGTLHCSFRTAFLVVWCAVCSDHFCRSNFYPERDYKK